MNNILDDIVEEETIEGVNNEGDISLETLLEDEQEETTEDSSPKETEGDTDSEQSENKEETEEEKVPFHKHPRWKQQQEELKELREFKESQAGLADTVAEIQKAQTTQQEVKLPKWWTTLYGDDDVSATAFVEYNSHESEMKASIKKEAIDEYKSELEKQDAETKKWDAWVDSEIEALKSEGETFDKNALLKVATEWQPTDSDGNVSLRKSLEILKMQSSSKSESNEERKKVAAKTSSNNQGGSTATKSMTSQDLRGKSMHSLIHGSN